MGLGVQILQVTGVDLSVDVLLELRLEALLVVVGKTLHVLSNVATEDVLAESFGVEFLRLDIEPGETVLGVRDENSTIGCTLHGGENTGTGRSAVETDIEESLEGAAGAVVGFSGFGESVLSLRLLLTDEVLIKTQLLQSAAGQEETGGVGGRPVGETVVDAIALEFVGVSAGKDLVAGDLSGDDLGDDVTVCEADDEAVLGRVVLVFGLGDQALAGIVVGLTLTTTLELGLEAAVNKSPVSNCRFTNSQANIVENSPEVSAALDLFLERLQVTTRSAICASETLYFPKQLAKTQQCPSLHPIEKEWRGIVWKGNF